MAYVANEIARRAHDSVDLLIPRGRNRSKTINEPNHITVSGVSALNENHMRNNYALNG